MKTTDSWLGNGEAHQKLQAESEKVVLPPGKAVLYSVIIALFLVVGYLALPRIWFLGALDWLTVTGVMAVTFGICWFGARQENLDDDESSAMSRQK